MPVTPFHFGPGAFAKSLSPRWFSLRAFILSQVVIDCETMWNLFSGNQRLHTVFHSYLGVILAMGLTGLLLVGSNWAFTRLSKVKAAPNANLSQGFESRFETFEFHSAFVAILFGGFSHVFLDSLMHQDMRPFMPFSEANPMLTWLSLGDLHTMGVLGFVGAVVVWGGRTLFGRLCQTSTR